MGKFKKDNINALCKKYTSTMGIEVNSGDYIVVEVHKNNLELRDYEWIPVDPINDSYYCLWYSPHGLLIKLYRYHEPEDNIIKVSFHSGGVVSHIVEFDI